MIESGARIWQDRIEIGELGPGLDWISSSMFVVEVGVTDRGGKLRTVIPHVNDSQRSGAAILRRAGRRRRRRRRGLLFSQDQLGQGRGRESLEGSDSGHFLAVTFCDVGGT